MSCNAFAPTDGNPNTKSDQEFFVSNITNTVRASACVSNVNCFQRCSFSLSAQDCINCVNSETNCQEAAKCLTCLSEHSDDLQSQVNCARNSKAPGLSDVQITAIIIGIILGIFLAVFIPVGIHTHWFKKN